MINQDLPKKTLSIPDFSLIEKEDKKDISTYKSISFSEENKEIFRSQELLQISARNNLDEAKTPKFICEGNFSRNGDVILDENTDEYGHEYEHIRRVKLSRCVNTPKINANNKDFQVNFETIHGKDFLCRDSCNSKIGCECQTF